MSTEPIAITALSVSRCLANPRFLDRFYELFVSSSDEIAAKFRDTDFDRQKRALASSLYLMVMAMEEGDAAIAYLEKIADRHNRHDLDIRPEMYDVWLDCLVCAAGECDPDFSDEIERGWRETMKFGIELMRKRH
jgi:hemoglobin-like flavoprotein